MKTIFFSGLMLLFIMSNSYGQTDWAANDVHLESSSFNKAHPYYEFFRTQDEDYIKWLYYGCTSSRTSYKDLGKESGPLIFRITKDGSSRYDTILNCVHPSIYETDRESGWESIIPIHGALPNGVWGNLENNPKGNTNVALYVQKKPVNAKIEVLTEEGELVSTLVEAYLEQGEYDFTWRPISVDPGSYLLYTRIDEGLMIQRIQVVKSWMRTIFSDIYGKIKGRAAYRKYQKSEPSGGLPKGTILALNHDRHGVTLGLTTLPNSQVCIKLLRPDGSLLKNLVDENMKNSEYSSLLNNHVAKSGTYLLFIEVNGEERTQKIKLKKHS